MPGARRNGAHRGGGERAQHVVGAGHRRAHGANAQPTVAGRPPLAGRRARVRPGAGGRLAAHAARGERGHGAPRAGRAPQLRGRLHAAQAAHAPGAPRRRGPRRDPAAARVGDRHRTVGLGGLLLFGVLFLWQIPHFAAITIFRAEDYRRAGLQVVSVQHGERAARETIALYTFLLVGASLLFVPFGLSGPYYAAAATGLGAIFSPSRSAVSAPGRASTRTAGPSASSLSRSSTCPRSSSRCW